MKGNAMTLKELIKLKQADWGMSRKALAEGVMRTMVRLAEKGLLLEG